MLRPGEFPWERVLYSGDLFRTDDEGYLYFVGRKDDIIKTRGEKVSPKEVEEVLYSFNGVAEAAVVAVPTAFSEARSRRSSCLKKDTNCLNGRSCGTARRTSKTLLFRVWLRSVKPCRALLLERLQKRTHLKLRSGMKTVFRKCIKSGRRS